MMTTMRQRARRVICGTLVAGAAFVLTASASAAPEALNVILDQARIIKLPDRVATLVIGNPLIADVSLQPGGLVVVTGKGYGATNMIALDRGGNLLMEKAILVESPREQLVTVYKGTLRESYSCAPKCEPRITLGDATQYFDANLAQAANRAGMAQGLQAAK